MTDKREQEHDAILAALHAFERSEKPAPFNQMKEAIEAYSASLTRPASGDAVEAGKVRDTPGLRASRESLGITQDEQRRRAMAAASRMKAEGTASKPGPATTEDPAQTEVMALADPTMKAQVALDPDTPPLVIAVEQAIKWFDDYAESHAAKEREAVAVDDIEAGFRRKKSQTNKERADYLRAALRQPASVEAEPVALLRDIVNDLTDQRDEPLDEESSRLHYWRDKAIAAADRIDAHLADQVQS